MSRHQDFAPAPACPQGPGDVGKPGAKTPCISGPPPVARHPAVLPRVAAFSSHRGRPEMQDDERRARLTLYPRSGRVHAEPMKNAAPAADTARAA